jgi:hypothetical protein
MTASPKPNHGQFRKGHDPRRHKLTREERQRGRSESEGCATPRFCGVLIPLHFARRTRQAARPAEGVERRLPDALGFLDSSGQLWRVIARGAYLDLHQKPDGADEYADVGPGSNHAYLVRRYD